MSRSSEATLSGFKIRVVRQSASPIDHTLEHGRSVFIGCGDSCGIQVKGEKIAEIHCLVDVSDEGVSVQDWASEAGTKVNGTLIDDKTPLSVGDTVVLGTTQLELLGPPDGVSARPVQQTSIEEEPREESVGMEHMGYEESDGAGLAVAEPSVIEEPAVELDACADQQADTFSNEPDEAAFESTFSNEFEQPAEAHEAMSDLGIEPNDPGLNDLSDHDDTSGSMVDDDLDWDPFAVNDDEQVDAEIVELLKSEIEDLRIQLAERDEQIATLGGIEGDDSRDAGQSSVNALDDTFGGAELAGRVEELLAELSEHDERVSTLQELLQTAEIQNQAEREERNCLENWVGEIEQRIGERESEWQAEQDALRTRLEDANDQRNQLQQKLHAAAKRFGNVESSEVVPDETLQLLQKQNSELQSALEESQKQCASLTRQIERMQEEEPESLQELRAELAQEKASVSRMRFQLSKQLQDIEEVPQAKEQPDREFALKLQTLREHLREIHEEEKHEREDQGSSLFGRISNLWKRVDDEY